LFGVEVRVSCANAPAMDSRPLNGSSPNVWCGVPAVNGVTGAKRAYGHTGHGFGPPATPADNNALLAVLDLSSSANRAESAPNTSARPIRSPPSGNCRLLSRPFIYIC
jgi:hypothetical protein